MNGMMQVIDVDRQGNLICLDIATGEEKNTHQTVDDVDIEKLAWMEKETINLARFFRSLNLCVRAGGMLSAHYGKCYGFAKRWREAGIPFKQGEMVYMLTYTPEFASQVRDTPNGWVDPCQWVIDNYDYFKPHFPELLV